MSNLFARVGRATAVVALSALLVSAGAYVSGIRINSTPSIPLGVYVMTDAPITKGAYVRFCPSLEPAFELARDRGYITTGFCPGSFGYMAKKVLAAEGDVLDVGDDGVTVNGVPLPRSAPLAADLSGRPLPRWHATGRVLGPDELLVMSDVSAKSFDSRYFGPVRRSQVQAVIRPLLTW